MTEREVLHYMVDNPGKVVVHTLTGQKFRMRPSSCELFIEYESYGEWINAAYFPIGEYRVEEEDDIEKEIEEIFKFPCWSKESAKAQKAFAAAILRKVEKMIEERK